MKTRDVARLHPRTVTDYGKHLRKVPRSRGNRAPITALQVDPRVWKTALALSEGNPRRIAVISELEVIVFNCPR